MDKDKNLKIMNINELNRNLHILFKDGIIVLALLIITKDNSNYISMLDSTGFCKNLATKFVSYILKGYNGMIICFSHPKESLIFQHSCNKNVLSPSKLFGFWRKCLENRCVECKDTKIMTWSNFNSENEHPYKNINEITHYDDDPKSKLMKNLNLFSGEPTILFQGLLSRSDFIKGGLLFSICNGIHCSSLKFCNKDLNINLILDFLRSLDMTTKILAEQNYQIFLMNYLIAETDLYDFNIDDISCKESNTVVPIYIKPRKL